MNHPHHPRLLVSWVRPLTLSIPLAFALVACGGGGGGNNAINENNGNQSGSSADPLSSYKTQALNWVSCSDSAMGVVSKLQCARFKAPLDYAAPEKGDISIEAMRVPAMSAQRKGAIFFNPGGPGGDGLQVGLYALIGILTQKGASQQVMTLQAQLVNGYDLLGFNPRGTGSKAPLSCASDADELVTNEISSARNLPGNFEAMSSNQQAIAQACQSNPLTPYISTDATARDMDLLRTLMGDSKISYIGYSYGTWLGAWYARLFPEHVDRMVLDSNADVSADHMDFTEQQAIARDTLITDLLAPYASRHPDTYNLGNTSDSVRATLAALNPALKHASAQLFKVYSNTGTIDSMNSLVAANGLDQLLKTYPDDQIAAAIETYQFVPYSSSITNYSVRQSARDLWSGYQSVRDNANNIGQPYTKTFLGPEGGSNGAVLFSVTCNDSAPPSRDINYWKALGDTIAQKAPFFGGYNPPTQTCMYWNTPDIQRPPLAGLQGLDVLMLQSQYDAATPSIGAMKGFSALPKAHMVYVANEYTHGVFPYGTDCVDVPVLQYLLGQSPNWRQYNCPASGAALPLDKQLSRSVVASAKSSESTQTSSRNDLINEFKMQIGRNELH